MRSSTPNLERSVPSLLSAEGTSGKGELWKPERNQVSGKKSTSCTELAVCPCGPISALDRILLYVVLQESPAQSCPLNSKELWTNTLRGAE